MATNIESGKIGEHICMVRLMKMGVACEIVNLETMDIVAHVGSEILRIQVKSSKLKTNGRGAGRNSPGLQFAVSHTRKKIPLTKDECDIIAFVSLDQERVMFKPVECLKGQVTKRFVPQKFEKDRLEERSWQYCLDCIFLGD